MATIVMESAKVIEAANKVISNIEDKRNKRDDEAIAKTMAYPRLGAWFKRYNPTREQAIKILNESSMWGWRSQYAWGDLDSAKKLLKLAQHGDPVTLNENDIAVLL